MTSETKAEMVVGGAVAAFLLWLWLHNAQATGNTGLPFKLPEFLQPKRLHFEPDTFTVGPGAAGDTFNYTGTGDINLGTRRLGNVDGSSGCDCNSSASGAMTFGADTDLSAWIASQPDLMDAAASGLKGYY